MDCLRSLSECSVELTVYQGQLHLVTFLRGCLVQICACPVYVYTVQHSVLLRRPPRGANSFFFFFFLKYEKYELNCEFLKGKYAETGNLDLENFNKTEMDNFD